MATVSLAEASLRRPLSIPVISMMRSPHHFAAVQSLLCSVLLGLLASQAAQAELTWAQHTIEVTGDAQSPVIDAHFHFTNTGSGPVEIRKVESSCGCTTTDLAKRTYQPEESGEIVAHYTVGAHTGLQRKTLLVITDDGCPATTLTLEAHIPEILRITPAMVTWSHNELTAPKDLTLDLLQATPLDDIVVESTSANIKTTLVAIAKGRKYTLVVTPKQTDRFLYSKLTIHCRFGSEEKTFVAYATVKPSTGEQ